MRSVSDLESPWDLDITRLRRWLMRRQCLMRRLTRVTFGLTAITTPTACGSAASGDPASVTDMAALAVTGTAALAVTVTDADSSADGVSAVDTVLPADGASLAVMAEDTAKLQLFFRPGPPCKIYWVAFSLKLGVCSDLRFGLSRATSSK